jgi:hypothetical protein
MRMLSEHYPIDERRAAIILFDDMIDYAVVSSVQYAQAFSDILVQGLTDDNETMRQVCAYGIGCMAKHPEQAYAQIVQHSLETIVNVI